MIDYVLLVILFLIALLLGYYVGRRDERRSIQDFCDYIGLSDLMYEMTETWLEEEEDLKEEESDGKN